MAKLQFDGVNAIKTMTALAAGTLDEAELAAWFRQRLWEQHSTGGRLPVSFGGNNYERSCEQ